MVVTNTIIRGKSARFKDGRGHTKTRKISLEAGAKITINIVLRSE